mgnify:CR=1 FL=1
MSNKTANYKGEVVDVISTKAGWTTIQLESGTIKKVRNGDLKVKEAKAPKAAPTKTPKAAKAPKAANKTDDGDTRLVKAKLENYVRVKNEGRDGGVNVDCDDKVAKSLRNLDLKGIYAEAARATGETQKALGEQYQHLNVGMQRMVLGNRIRGAASAAAAAKAK